MTAVLNVTPEQDVQTFPGITFRLPDSVLTDETFFEFCQLNPELRIERDAQKNIFIMAPTTSETGNRNAKLTIEIGIWNKNNTNWEKSSILPQVLNYLTAPNARPMYPG